MSDNLCWTSFVGAPTHNLGDLPEECLTCTAKRREGDVDQVACSHRVSGADACDCEAIARVERRDSESKVGQD